jgi:hypothetical protein
VEFKRKYPASDGGFGLDEYPHCQVAAWLNARGSSLLHVILSDPLWDPDVSPLHLLEAGSATAAKACWLGVNVTDDAFAPGSYRTEGRASGMYGGVRLQRKIAISSFHLLGEGLHSSGLGRSIRDLAEMPRVPDGFLLRARDAVKRSPTARRAPGT